MMRLVSFALFLALAFVTLTSMSAESTPSKKAAAEPAKSASETCTVQIKIDDVIGPGTLDYMERGFKEAEEKNCGSLLMLINTPGGNLQSTRLIVEKILNSKMAVLCLVYPAGAHAGSAGAIIMQACHVSGGVETTNLGAATPIEGSGADIAKDLKQKVLNDTVSWVEGLAELRGRDKKFAREIVEKARVASSKEAQAIGAIDFVGEDIPAFTKFANGRTTKLAGQNGKIAAGMIQAFEPDLRYRVLEFVAHPQIAYMLFMISIGLLYFEMTHPGMVLPGVVGGVGLIISLISFHMLDVQWGGLALLVLGLIFLIAEAFVPSFGALGIGGIIAFVMGGLFLFDPAVGTLPLSLILPTAVTFGLIMFGLAYLALQTRSVRKKGGFDDLVGAQGRVSVIDKDSKQGKVEVHGEIWNFKSNQSLKVGDTVRVEKVAENFTLQVGTE